MNQLIWRLSGPNLFVGRLAESASLGCSVVISAQHSLVPDMSFMICSALRTEGLCVDQISASESPIDALGDLLCCGPAMRSLDAICDACHGVRCFVVEVENAEKAGNWSQFLGRLQHRARQNGASQRPVLILIHRCRWPSQSPTDDVAVTSLSWDDALSKDDLISFSHSLLMRRDLAGILRQVLVHTLAEISLTDIDLMKSLAGEALDEIAWPFVSLRNWAGQKGFVERDAPPRIYIEGQFFDHSAWLAWKDDRASLRRRIWVAQARVLLPWVEDQRAKLLPSLEPWLPTEHGGQPKQELELGSLDFLLTRTYAPRSLKNIVRTLKKARNEIAHCASLPYSDLLALTRLQTS